jgi:hypothetical protein
VVELRKTARFARWLDGLQDIRGRARIQARIGAAIGARSVGVAEMKKKMATTRYDVAEHLRTPEEMAAYLEACFE